MRSASPKQQRHPTGRISEKRNDENDQTVYHHHSADVAALWGSDVSSPTQAEPLWNYLPFDTWIKASISYLDRCSQSRFWLCYVLVSWAIKCVNSYQVSWTVLTRSKRQLLFVFCFLAARMWNLSSLIRVGARAPCSKSAESTSGPLRKSPCQLLFVLNRTVRSLGSTYKIL